MVKTVNINEVVDQYYNLKAEQERINKELENLKENIISALGNDKSMIVNNYRVDIKNVSQERFDVVKFRKENENLYDQYKKEIEFTSLKITKI